MPLSSSLPSRTLPLLALGALGCASGGNEPDVTSCEVDLDCDRRSFCDPELGICVPLPDAGQSGDGGEDEPDAGQEEEGLCSECERNADCVEAGAICLRAEIGPRFCGRLCGENLPACPAGFDCADVTDWNGDPAGTQCVPTNGDCSCLPDRDGASRSCVVENDWGACEGIQRCFGDTGWGTCQAPEPAPEVCDGQDNDCDGARDEEEDLDLGTCGLGVCEAAEECVATPDGAELECEPGSQRLPDDTDCNDEDDDCDGLIDEAYVPFTCGLGVCARESICNPGGSELCVAGEALAQWDDSCNGLDEDCSGEADEDYVGDPCGLGICVRYGTCVDGEPVCVPGTPEPDDVPELGFEDSNCDGIDGDVADGIFVDWVTGDDANPGTIDEPMATISAAIDAADIAGKHVYISAGTYAESIVLQAGVGLYGGYSAADGWTRSVGNIVEISGGTTAVSGNGIAETTELQLLTIRSADASTAGGSSYGIFLVNCEGVTLTSVTIRAGSGRRGTDGTDGSDGDDGGDGYAGAPGCEDSTGFCSSCTRPAGGAGGTSTCAHGGGDGGQPGKGGNGGDRGDASEDGTSGGPGGSGGGWGNGTVGTSGADGDPGTDGSAGAAFGTTSANGYAVSNGTGGTDGTDGRGGGGGGGGGGGNDDCDSYGSAGGGGGAGGCHGTRGTRGTGGGGSFAVFLWASTIDATDCDFGTGAGGDGGLGGTGGDGGVGGDWGAGGPYGGGSEQDDGGDGARGGAGGDAGRGGHGGGGGGGPSIGIECANGSDITTDLGNDFSLGSAGSGGASAGNDGATGRRANRDGC